MADENVEVVKRALDAWSRRDLATALELAVEDVEIVPAFAAQVEGQTFRGPGAIASFFRSVDSFFESFSTSADELRAVDENRVLAIGRVKARGSGSGAEIDQQWGSLWELDGGRITRIQTFFDHQQARAAAGLAP